MTGQFTSAAYRIGPRTLVPLARGRIENYTDPMSNAVSLSSMDVRALIKQAIPGALPLTDQAMRFFLQEIAHHATFANRVGSAQSALATSVCARAHIGGAAKGRTGLRLQQRDDIVLRYFGTIFEPLVEGVALFAEHDVQWGDFEIASHPLLHLWALFLSAGANNALSEFLAHQVIPNQAPDLIQKADPIHKLRVTYAATVNDRLMIGRTGDYWIEQKARLLCQPLVGKDRGPAYLLGYLAVKRTYLLLRSVSEMLADSDCFLLLMLGYWFSDKPLAECLLSLTDADIMSVQETMAELTNRLENMCEQLFRNPSEQIRHLVGTLSGGGQPEDSNFF